LNVHVASNRMCCWIVLRAYLCNTRAISTVEYATIFVRTAASAAWCGFAGD
jgi:hypothetical protein